MGTNFTHQIRNSLPLGLLRPPTPRFSAVGSCRTGEPSPSLLTTHIFILGWCAPAHGVSCENGPEWTRISRIRWEIPGPRGGYVLQHRASARWARCRTGEPSLLTTHIFILGWCAPVHGVSCENGPEWTRVSRIRWEIPGPRGGYVLQHRASARWARAEPVSCCSLCSWAMVHMITVQLLTEKRRISWWSPKI